MQNIIEHMRGWTFYDWAWIAWIAGFFAIEIKAVKNKTHGDTLSETFHWITGQRGKAHKHVWSIRAILFGGTCWLIVHLWGKKWKPI